MTFFLFLFSSANEQVWLRIGAISDLMEDHDKALQAFQCALRHNEYNVRDSPPANAAENSVNSIIENIQRARSVFGKALKKNMFKCARSATQ